MRYIMIGWGWLNIRLTPLIPRILAISIVFASLMSVVTFTYKWLFIINNLNSTNSVSSFRFSEFFLNVFTSSIFFLLWNGIYFTFHFFQKSRLQEVNNLQLEASQTEIELKNLRSQLNPHFLFNSLNNIRALIEIDPVQAKHNITTLANLLRKSLMLGKERLVTLREELDLVEDYLELEKVRFEERVTIEMKLDTTLNKILIPPFILQTLTENAFKHGISKLIEGGVITIETFREANKVILIVRNDGKLNKDTFESDDTGIGIENTIKRLQLIYGTNATFTLAEKDGKIEAKIEIENQ